MPIHPRDVRFRSRLYLTLALACSCGPSAVGPIEQPARAEIDPDERLVQLWFRSLELDVARERGRPDEAARRALVEETAALAESLGPRCDVIATWLRNLEPNGSDESIAHGPEEQAGALITEVLSGRTTDGARCGVARVREGNVWFGVMFRRERDDGIEAAIEARPERRAEIDRARALVAQIDDEISDELLALLERWSPGDDRIDTLRTFEARETFLDSETPVPASMQRQFAAWSTVDAILLDLMPPVAGRSEVARASRAYWEALRDDPARAMALAADLPELEEHEERADLRAACSGGAPEPEADVDDRIYEVPYSCAAELEPSDVMAYGEHFAEMQNPRAQELFAYACEAGHTNACIARANDALERGEHGRAAAIVRPICEGDGEEGARRFACGALGVALRGEGRHADAVPHLRAACEIGDDRACGVIVEMEIAGEHTPPDEQLYEDARVACARRGREHPACIFEADLLRTGHGIARNVPEAMGRYATLCNDEGSLPACWHLARGMLHVGPDVTNMARDIIGLPCGNQQLGAFCAWSAYFSAEAIAERVDEAQRGCERGSPDGCAVRAMLERGGDARLRETCDAGSSIGCFVLAERRVRRARDEARELYRRACEDDDAMALGCAELAALEPNAEAARAARDRACVAGRDAECP